eukprot:PhM_4_TR18849/c4_g2_i3/m.100430
MPHYIRISSVEGQASAPQALHVDMVASKVSLAPSTGAQSTTPSRRTSFAGGKETILKRRMSAALVAADQQKEKAADDAAAPGGSSNGMLVSQIFPSNMEHDEVAKYLSTAILPQVVKRNNVTLITHGHTQSGKSQFLDKFLEPLLESLKAAISSADEAYQESVTAGLTDGPANPSKDNGPPRMSNAALDSSEQDDDRFVAKLVDGMSPSFFGRDSTHRPATTTSKYRTGSPSSPVSRAKTPGFINDQVSITFGPPGSPFGMQKTMAFFDHVRQSRNGLPLIPPIRGLKDAIDHNKSIEAVDTSQRNAKLNMSSRGMQMRLSARRAIPLQNDHPPPKTGGIPKGVNRSMYFSGTKSFLTMPEIPKLEEIIQKGVFEFWVRVDPVDEVMCFLSIQDEKSTGLGARIVFNSTTGGEHLKGCVLFAINDNNQRLCEGTLQDEITPGTWHHVLWTINNVRDNSMAVSVDSRTSRLKVVTTDGPAAFAPFQQRFYLGGAVYKNPNDMHIANPFKGFCADLRIKQAGSLKGHWHMSNIDTIDKVADRSGVSEPADCSSGLLFGESQFPQTAWYLDGIDCHMNIGALADFGMFLNAFTIELSFKTSCVSERMSLIGVHDDVAKQAGFGIDLNIDVHSQFHKCFICFWVRDIKGLVLRQGVELSDAFDDKWHTLTWRVIDAATGKMKVRLDNRPRELETPYTNEGPCDFGNLRQWIAVGATNKRGKTTRNFKGYIRNVKVVRVRPDREDTIAMYPLDDGPCARLAVDSTGHGLHGVLVTNGAVGSIWYPSEMESEDDAALSSALNTADMQIVRFTNNIVSLAVLADVVVSNSSGMMSEVLLDLFHNQPVRMAKTNLATKRSPMCEGRVVSTLPSECFVAVNAQNYMEKFQQGIKAYNGIKHKCNLVVIVRLGDALFTIIDLQGMSLSPKAHFDDRQLVWVDVLNNFGVENKAKMAANRTLMNVEKVLLSIGSAPQVYKRGQLLSHSPKEASGALATTVLSHLIRGVEFANLHIIHTFSGTSSRDEVMAELGLIREMGNSAKGHAAIVVQKNWRGFIDRRTHARLDGIRTAERRREERIATIRRQFPAQSAHKEKRRVLLIPIGYFDDPHLRRIEHLEDDVWDLKVRFETLGYHTELLMADPPNREAILDTIEKLREKTDEQLIVYVSGYVVQGGYYRQPPPNQFIFWLSEDEYLQRKAIDDESVLEYTQLEAEEQRETARIEEEIRIREEELAKKKKKKAKPKAGAKNDKVEKKEEKKKKEKEKPVEIIEPEPPELVEDPDYTDLPAEANDVFFLCADTPCTYRPETCLRLSDIESLVVGRDPVRGVHTVLIYDLVDLGVGSEGKYGLAGAVTSGQEVLQVQYREGQRGLLTYYLKKALDGDTASAITIGKREPPSVITVTHLGMHLKKKLYGERSVIDIKHDLGEYVGDILLASKVLNNKDARKKKKIELKGKRVPVHVVLAYNLAENQVVDVRRFALEVLSPVIKDPHLEVRRFKMRDRCEFLLKSDDCNEALFKERAMQSIRLDVQSLFPGVALLTHRIVAPPLRIMCSQMPLELAEPEEPNPNPDGPPPPVDPKLEARKFAANLSKQETSTNALADASYNIAAKAMLDKSTIGGYPIASVVGYVDITISMLELSVPKLDRMFRSGLPLCAGVYMDNVHVLSEGDAATFNKEEAMLALYDQLRQSDEKARIAREAEVARKREEERLANEMKAAKALTQLEDYRGANHWSKEMIGDIFIVAHKELYNTSMEAMCTMMSSLPNAAQLCVESNLIQHTLNAIETFPADCKDRGLRLMGVLITLPEPVPEKLREADLATVLVPLLVATLKEKLTSIAVLEVLSMYMSDKVVQVLRSRNMHDTLINLAQNVLTEPVDVQRALALAVAYVDRENEMVGDENLARSFLDFVQKEGEGIIAESSRGLLAILQRNQNLLMTFIEEVDFAALCHSLCVQHATNPELHRLWVMCLAAMDPNAIMLAHQKATALLHAFEHCKNDEGLTVTICTRLTQTGQLSDADVLETASLFLESAKQNFPENEVLQQLSYA